MSYAMISRTKRGGRRWSVATYSTGAGERRWFRQWSSCWGGRFRPDGALAPGIGVQVAVAGRAISVIVWPPKVEPVFDSNEAVERERRRRVSAPVR